MFVAFYCYCLLNELTMFKKVLGKAILAEVLRMSNAITNH